jgi:hypothetical protein
MPGSACAQTRYRTPLVTKVEASRAKVSQDVRICPFSAHEAVSGLAPVPSRTYIRIAQMSLVAPAAK